MFQSRHANILSIVLAVFPATAAVCCGQIAEPWRSQYSGRDASGAHVITLWQFQHGTHNEDASKNGHSLMLRGATIDPKGRFHEALRIARTTEDRQHAAIAAAHADLSPRGAFTIEMWIQPDDQFADFSQAFLIDKKYVAHDDYQWTLGKADTDGGRQMVVTLGFGNESASFYSPRRVVLQAGQWYHVAFSYDGAGTVSYQMNGENYGSVTKPGRAGVHAGRHNLSIGDRIGSTYGGFPGLIDQVRMTHGVREFRPISVSPLGVRTAFLRMEDAPPLKYVLKNLTAEELNAVEVTMSIRSDGFQPTTAKSTVAAESSHTHDLPPSEAVEIAYELDTTLRPGDYHVQVAVRLPSVLRVASETAAAESQTDGYRNVESFPVRILPRPTPHRMPVVMWGGPGRSKLDELTGIGFTHFLGLSIDHHQIWKAGKPIQARADRHMRESQRLLNDALARNLRVVAQIQPGSWLAKNSDTANFLRVGRDGKALAKKNVTASFPEVLKFGFNVGASVAQTDGGSPALAAALINSEIRSSYSDVSFHPHEQEAFRKHAGFDIPAVVTSRFGVPHAKLSTISAERVISDDDPVYTFYKWFWKRGDGWNDFNSAIHDGLKSTGRDDLWTFFDPAVRVPSVFGSGGNVNVISHWTYSYPDPIRIGLTTDELFAMADGSKSPQDVMKMTQIIWYRSQTAPVKKSDQDAANRLNVTEDFDPTYQFITISPMHLREAFWTKIARPIKGIMYHGWQSLVQTEATGGYRYTHPETQHELTRLIKDIVKPLGPTLTQIPAANTDVAFLESFASQMFAGRGTYGWAHRWTGEMWHVLQYAHLQPRVVYEETINRDGLDHYKVLVMPSCDVLPASIVERVKQFQQRGGIIIADERIAPAIKPDILIPIYDRTKQAAVDKDELLKRAAVLRTQLDARYRRYVDTSDPDAIAHLRRFNTTDYVFTVNDRREAGDYVGHHGLVLERGLPAQAMIMIDRSKGHIYDLVANRQIDRTSLPDGGISSNDQELSVPVSLGPADGGILMITERAISQVLIQAPESVQRERNAAVKITVADREGVPIDAVVPLRVDISDPTGRSAEYSGNYGAKSGSLVLQLAIAPNDVTGTWHVRVQELASGLTSHASFRVADGR